MKRTNVAARACGLAAVVVVTCTAVATADQGGAQRPGQPAQQTTPPPAGAPMPNMPGMKMDMGIVTGVVTKAGGGAVAGATVTVTNTANGIKFSASTDDDGRFNLPSLPAGTYDVAAQLGGFKPFRRPGVVVAKGCAHFSAHFKGARPNARTQPNQRIGCNAVRRGHGAILPFIIILDSCQRLL